MDSVQENQLGRNLVEENVCDLLELFPKFLLVARNQPEEHRLPVVVHKLVHRFPENFIAVEKIIEPHFHPLGLKFDFVTGDVDVSVVVLALKVFAMELVSRQKLIHRDVRKAFAHNRQHQDLSFHFVLTNEIQSLRVSLRLESKFWGEFCSRPLEHRSRKSLDLCILK